MHINRIFMTVPQIINLLPSCIQLTEQIVSTYARILASQIHVRCLSHLHNTHVLSRNDRCHRTRITPEDLPEGLLTPCTSETPEVRSVHNFRVSRRGAAPLFIVTDFRLRLVLQVGSTMTSFKP